MLNKIKEFLNNGKVRAVEFVVLGLMSAGLLLGGETTQAVQSIVPLVSGIISAIGAIVVAINALVKEGDNK